MKMNDQAKVIEALKNCTTKPKCRDCPWETCESDHEYVELPMDLAKQALKLLEAQMPRVMTPDLREAEWRDKVIWLEIKGKEPTPCLFREYMDLMMFGRYERLMYFDVVGSFRESGYMLNNYRVKWRCWTSVPNDEQRRSVPWQSQS